MSDLDQAADALQSFHDLARPKCCREDGCNLEPRCEDECDKAEHVSDDDLNAHARAERRAHSRYLSEKYRRG